MVEHECWEAGGRHAEGLGGGELDPVEGTVPRTILLSPVLLANSSHPEEAGELRVRSLAEKTPVPHCAGEGQRGPPP